MSKQITIDSKIGYLNPKTGRYEWSTITGIDSKNNTFKLRQKLPGQGRRVIFNEYSEQIENVIKFSKTPSQDFKDGRPLIRIKCCQVSRTKYMTSI